MEGLTRHEVTMYQHVNQGGQRSFRWACSCGEGEHHTSCTAATQTFAEHYALAMQQAAPKVRRRAPARDGGRTLTLDTIRDSEKAVLLSMPETLVGFTDDSIRYYAGTERVMDRVGMFSDSRLRTARVELQRAGLVEATGELAETETGRRARTFRMTDAGLRMRRALNGGASATSPPSLALV